MKPRKTPLRMCLGCMEMKEKGALVRVVKDKDGHVSLDSTGKKNGRGAYVCRSAECLASAIKARRLERTFSMQIPDEIYASLKKEMNEIES